MRAWVITLVVTVMGLVVVGLGLAAIARVRDEALRIQCQNNLKQIGLTVHSYGDTYNHFPEAAMPNPALPPEKRLSWLVAIMPYLESNSLFAKLDRDKSWDAEENRFAALTTIRTYQCPADPNRTPVSTLEPTHYIGIAGVGPDAALLPRGDPRAGFFGYERKLTPKDFAGHSSTLLMAVETAQVTGSWTAGGPPTVRGLEPDGPPYLGANGQFGGTHRRGTNFLFADASVRMVADSLDRRVFEAMAMLKGSEGVRPLGEE
jgi:prepilin-type processing-associated H-X9-DG protein